MPDGMRHGCLRMRTDMHHEPEVVHVSVLRPWMPKAVPDPSVGLQSGLRKRLQLLFGSSRLCNEWQRRLHDGNDDHVADGQLINIYPSTVARPRQCAKVAPAFVVGGEEPVGRLI